MSLENCPICKKSDQLRQNYISAPISALIVGFMALPMAYITTTVMQHFSISSSSPLYAVLIIGMLLAILSLLKFLPKKYYFIYCKRCDKYSFPGGITTKIERRDRIVTIFIIVVGMGIGLAIYNYL